MKTLQDLFEEVMGDDDEKRAFVAAVKADDVEGFLKQHDCDASKEELEEFLESKSAKDEPMELSAEELEKVAGGTIITDIASYACDKNKRKTPILPWC